jgi:hypothetical protein
MTLDQVRSAIIKLRLFAMKVTGSERYLYLPMDSLFQEYWDGVLAPHGPCINDELLCLAIYLVEVNGGLPPKTTQG